jgi:fermentation-respiration switch protein FrsA (DUF1100 family)
MNRSGICIMLSDDANKSSDDVERTRLAAKPKKKKKRKSLRSRPARLTIAVLRLVGLGYATILVSLVLMETRLVYPGAYFADNRALDDAHYPEIETVEYGTTDRLTLRGRLMERDQSEEIVLFFHGNGVKAKWMDSWLYLLSDEFNATVMVAEYRGYDDDVTPDETGVLADCLAARDYLCERYGKSPADIILYGRSLGGGCAVAIAAQGGAKALILERTFDRLVNVAGGKYPFIPVNLLMRNRFDSIAKMTVYDGPLIQLHGTTDDLIPIEHGEALCDSAGCEQKHWIAVEGLGHNDSLPLQSLREIVAKVQEFTSTHRDATTSDNGVTVQR